MNTLFYQGTSVLVVHRQILSEFIHHVAHDYRSSLTPPAAAPAETLTPEEQVKERMKLLTAKADYRKHRGTSAHSAERDTFIKAFLAAKVPNWGNVTLIV